MRKKARKFAGGKTSPTTLTLTLLRREGYTCAVVERWLPIPGKSIRQDLWGFADLIAVNHKTGDTLLVQCTSLVNTQARLTKARSKPGLAIWLKAGNRFEVHGWIVDRGRAQCKRVEVKANNMRDCFLVVPKKPRKRRIIEVPSVDLFADATPCQSA